MNLDNIVRFAFTHPDNKDASIREVARLLDINPGTVYRCLLRLRLVSRPPRCRQHSKVAGKSPSRHSRVPARLLNPVLADIYDELEMAGAIRKPPKK